MRSAQEAPATHGGLLLERGWPLTSLRARRLLVLRLRAVIRVDGQAAGGKPHAPRPPPACESSALLVRVRRLRCHPPPPLRAVGCARLSEACQRGSGLDTRSPEPQQRCRGPVRPLLHANDAQLLRKLVHPLPGGVSGTQEECSQSNVPPPGSYEAAPTGTRPSREGEGRTTSVISLNPEFIPDASCACLAPASDGGPASLSRSQDEVVRSSIWTDIQRNK